MRASTSASIRQFTANAAPASSQMPAAVQNSSSQPGKPGVASRLPMTAQNTVIWVTRGLVSVQYCAARAANAPAATPSRSSTSASRRDSADTVKPAGVHFSEADLDRLARKEHLNGRQIKNAVRSAQALAVNQRVPMGMAHVLKVLEVAEAFERDLKGGSGYLDAMRSYT